MTTKLSASSTVYPKFMVPRPIRLTSRPERPMCPYAIPSLMRRPYEPWLRPGMPCQSTRTTAADTPGDAPSPDERPAQEGARRGEAATHHGCLTRPALSPPNAVRVRVGTGTLLA